MRYSKPETFQRKKKEKKATFTSHKARILQINHFIYILTELAARSFLNFFILNHLE